MYRLRLCDIKITSLSTIESSDDDATLDQEFSSLNSYEEAPPGRNGAETPASEEEDEATPRGLRGDAAGIPSWATRGSEDSEASQRHTATTVLQQRPSVSSVESSRLPESESRPVQGRKQEKREADLKQN